MSHKEWCGRRQGRSQRIIKRLAVIGEDFLLPLRIGEELTLTGSLDIRVLRGAAEVWGYRLSHDFQRVVVPPWSATPRLLALRSEERGDAGDAGPEIRTFLETRKWPVVLCLRSATPATADVDRLQAMREILTSPDVRPRLRAHRAWPSLVHHFVDTCLHGSSPQNPAVLLVMGAKGVGKSTCCRFLVNSLLSLQVPEVFFLETDLGQPELGPPGVVTLHRIRRPMLQVPHSEQHRHERIKAFFAGAATSATHPALYTASVAAAFDAYCDMIKDDATPPPLMVNSHGWVTGLGLEMLQQIVATVGAQLVVRLQAEPVKRRGENAENEVSRDAKILEGEKKSSRSSQMQRSVLARCGPLARALARHKRGADGQPIVNPEASLVLVDVESAVPRGSTAPLAVQLRWLRMAGHFKPDLDPCRHATAMAMQDFFSTVPRWRLQMKFLHFGLVAGHLLHSEVEATLTGTVVALCATDLIGTNKDVSCTADLQLMEPHEAPIRFLAYAFVHSFDFKSGEVVIYSNISAEQLAHANLALRGEVTWEPNTTRNLQLADGRPSPLQPYSAPWLLEGMGVGTRVISTKAKGYLRRRSIRKI